MRRLQESNLGVFTHSLRAPTCSSHRPPAAGSSAAATAAPATASPRPPRSARRWARQARRLRREGPWETPELTLNSQRGLLRAEPVTWRGAPHRISEASPGHRDETKKLDVSVSSASSLDLRFFLPGARTETKGGGSEWRHFHRMCREVWPEQPNVDPPWRS